MGANLVRLLVGILVVACLPRTSGAEILLPQVRVLLINDGIVPADLAGRAQSEVTRLYKLIDVDVAWVDVSNQPDAGLRFIKVTTWEPREDRFDSSLGMTPTKRGRRPNLGYVFWGRVQRVAQKNAVGFDSLLAVAIAHELGHMLLGSSHSRSGLMHPSWDTGHLRSAAAGLLTFSPDSAASIHRGLMSQTKLAKRSKLPRDR